jgi:hypothetical protein
MKKSIMLVREHNDEVLIRVACGCEHSPEHDWEMMFRQPLADVPGYMEIEVCTHDESGYHGLWRRVQEAWRLIFHRWDTGWCTFVLREQEVEAFEEALKIARLALKTEAGKPKMTLAELRKKLSEEEASVDAAYGEQPC